MLRVRVGTVYLFKHGGSLEVTLTLSFQKKTFYFRFFRKIVIAILGSVYQWNSSDWTFAGTNVTLLKSQESTVETTHLCSKVS